MEAENKINQELHEHLMPQAWGTMQRRWCGLRTRWHRLALVYTLCRLRARAHAHTLFQPRNLFICQEIVMQPKTQELWCNYADVCTSTGRVGTPYLCIGHLLVLYSRA